MKRLLLLFVLLFNGLIVFCQAQYEISQDPKHPEVKVLKGIINKYLVQNDTSFKWFDTNAKFYNADTSILNAFERNKTKVQYIVFGGTWCEDTQFILPQFFKLQDMAGVPDKAISFFGVTRDKQTIGNLATALNITNVPTIIVMQDGKELGRVLEYGKTGKWDKELAEILPK